MRRQCQKARRSRLQFSTELERLDERAMLSGVAPLGPLPMEFALQTRDVAAFRMVPLPQAQIQNNATVAVQTQNNALTPAARFAERRAAMLEALEARRAAPTMPGPVNRGPFAPMPRPPAAFQATPLTDLGTGTYKGFQGGLYPGGRNTRPEAHELAGLERAEAVQPLDRNGAPSDDGQIVMLSIGMSNTSMEFEAFQQLAANDAQVNSDLVIVNGAQGGMAANAILNNPIQQRQFWRTIDTRLTRSGVSAEQVQVVWIKQADAGPRGSFPHHAQVLQQELAQITRMLKDQFPNLELAYVSSRTFGGYASIPLNPEPFAFESGFAVKWLLEQQLNGDPALNFDADRGSVEAPWLAWGPYLWANGTEPRSDGLSYSRADFATDGTHPSALGSRKVAEQLLDFFKTDSTTRSWFLGS